jgi:hypothetical protein
MPKLHFSFSYLIIGSRVFAKVQPQITIFLFTASCSWNFRSMPTYPACLLRCGAIGFFSLFIYLFIFTCASLKPQSYQSLLLKQLGLQEWVTIPDWHFNILWAKLKGKKKSLSIYMFIYIERGRYGYIMECMWKQKY